MLRRPTPQSMFDLKVPGSTTHKVHGSATPHKLYDAQLWGQVEASVLFGGVRRAAAHLSLLLLMGQAMLTILLCAHSSLPK